MSLFQTLPSPTLVPHAASTPQALPDFDVDDVFVLRSPLLPSSDAYTAWHRSSCLEDHLLKLAPAPRRGGGPLRGVAVLESGIGPLEVVRARVQNLPKRKNRTVYGPPLVRYACRMMTRSTPFGLFAGTALGRMGDQTRLVLGPKEAHRRHTRLDMDYLYRLVRYLESDVNLRRHWIYRPNSSLYRSAGRWRYAEGRLDGSQRAYHLVAVQDDPFLRVVLETARDGARLEELANALIAADVEACEDDGEIDREEATLYVHELIDAQILVSELGPHVTGLEPMRDLIQRLASQAETAPWAQRLATVQEALNALDAQPRAVDAPDRPYRQLARQLEPLGVDAPLPRLFQVDFVKSAPDLQLGPTVVDEVRRAVHALHRLRGTSNDPLATFRQDFLRRYEPGRAVPLVQVLDEEVGIGFNDGAGTGRHPSDLLQGAALSSRARPDASPLERYHPGRRRRSFSRPCAEATPRERCRPWSGPTTSSTP